MSDKTRNRSFIGGGAVYFREVGSAKGFFPVGNCEELSFAINEDKKTQRNFMQPGGGNVASQSAITDVTATLTALSFQPETLALALRALVVTKTGSAVAGETHKAHQERFIKFDNLPDKSQSITVTNSGATVTYAEGTDYQIKQNGIWITENSSIAGSETEAGADIVVNYTSQTSYSIQSITRAAVEYEIYFDGFNDADDGKQVAVTCHKVKFSPAQALGLITEDFASNAMNFEVLADTSKDGTSESQYFDIEMAA